MTTVLVIHAKHLTERLQHIKHQLKDWQGKVEYILDYDKDELTDEVISKYIQPGCELDNKSGATSCAIKHLLACQYIVEHQLEGALVLEDDIVLHPHFMESFEKTIKEYRRDYGDKPILISYEDSSLQFIPRSLRIKGKWLYKAPHGRVRFTGCLFVNQQMAQVIMDEVATRKCNIAIDHYHMHLYGEGKIISLWCEPCLATQGSFTGAFTSSIGGQVRSFETLRWKLKYVYKRLVYWFR
jgi:glycosyl transferase family 25